MRVSYTWYDHDAYVVQLDELEVDSNGKEK